ncbi:MAG: uroporphyrinogen decarboxylase, partial [Rothia sp. (in: high G+C Gram-positive bacteria)]|nr:uroporphyrinogen decarboxylase [Rothia sp. (in: high G+C Gram-positive bacteria)]
MTIHQTPALKQRPLLTAEQLAALPSQHPLKTARTGESAMSRTLTGRCAEHAPVWCMRLGGLSLPEYR